MSDIVVSSAIQRQAFDPLVRRLRRISMLSNDAIDILTSIPMIVQTIGARTIIGEAGHHSDRCCLVVGGVTAKATFMESGARQISALQIPGDFPELLSLLLPVRDFTLQTVTPCRLAFADRATILETISSSTELTRALWRETLIDGAVFRTSILRISQLSAVGRVAHFLCEMKLRHDIIDATNGDSFELDLTQQDLADALGLTFVSINRALKELREKKLVSFERPVVEIQQWSELVRFAEFDPTYLHLQSGAVIGTLFSTSK